MNITSWVILGVIIILFLFIIIKTKGEIIGDIIESIFDIFT